MHLTFHDVTLSDASTLAYLLVTSNESFRGHVPDQCLAFTEEKSAANWRKFLSGGLHKSHSIFIARIPSGIPVGYAWGCSTENDPGYAGELKQISVLPDYHRMGIGRALVQEVARRLAVRGIYSLSVHVLEVNPNRVFYERLGAVYVSQHPYDWDGFITPEYVYGWQNTQVLLQS